MQTQLLTNKAREAEVNSKISELEAKLKEANVKELLLKTKIASVTGTKGNHDSVSSSPSKNSDCEEEIKPTEVIYIDESHESNSEKPLGKPVKKLKIDYEIESLGDKSNKNEVETKNDIKSQSINLVEAKIIGLASTFLAIHPNGARVFDIWTYVNNLLPNLKLHELNEALLRYGNLFEATGNTNNNNNLSHIDQTWRFTGFAAEKASENSIKASIKEIAITNEL